MPARAAQSFAAAATIAKANEGTAAYSSHNAENNIEITKSAIASIAVTAATSPVAVSANTDTKARTDTPIMNEVEKGELLVNFERHRTAAAIVKSLLRLLHASSKYNFKTEPDVVSRCLWMAALPDDEITARSRNLV